MELVCLITVSSSKRLYLLTIAFLNPFNLFNDASSGEVIIFKEANCSRL